MNTIQTYQSYAKQISLSFIKTFVEEYLTTKIFLPYFIAIKSSKDIPSYLQSTLKEINVKLVIEKNYIPNTCEAVVSLNFEKIQIFLALKIDKSSLSIVETKFFTNLSNKPEKIFVENINVNFSEFFDQYLPEIISNIMYFLDTQDSSYLLLEIEKYPFLINCFINKNRLI